ncbi:hypothetical protein ThidrDRAFT_4587 [Thiorhodococcus drewsii AZ1]|uniref:Uncharacterized protein n=1 Tax=Thiorhodococcus drewsii AZ1 TaxID=765913 RepID=G2E8H3_9GAMM|nr:hypothetical protein [Thiorhodococcus drewsii]EGV27605.1 hypothetical protein ThidrDRAFT_4587 [Thiorhodococcus drewsii AZ1]
MDADDAPLEWFGVFHDYMEGLGYSERSREQLGAGIKRWVTGRPYLFHDDPRYRRVEVKVLRQVFGVEVERSAELDDLAQFASVLHVDVDELLAFRHWFHTHAAPVYRKIREAMQSPVCSWDELASRTKGRGH